MPDTSIPFVHLHVHTDYSLLDGAAKIETLVERAKAFGMPALAITDHGNMFGVLRFQDCCRKHGIKPLIGCEFYVAGGSRFERSGTEQGNKYYHLVLLAKNSTGYQNLMALSSQSWLEGFYYKPRIDEEILHRHSDGLICLSACIAGELPQLLLTGDDAKAEAFITRYREIFGEENFYVELQDHGLAEQKTVAPKLLAAAKKLGAPLVVTNDIHYVDADDWEAQEVMMCIGTKKTLDDPSRMTFGTHEFYLKSGKQMADLFADYPETVANTLKIAEMCDENVIKKYRTEDLKDCLPKYQIPDGYADEEAYLRALVSTGLESRYLENLEAARARADFELQTIIGMGFTGYFLIVWDFIHWAKQHEIPIGPGRGSGAGSIVAYAIGITNIDPLRFNLFFERFLNPERVSMPDFDIDISDENRKEVIEYTRQKYGEAQVGHIVTFSTLKAKSVIKDVGRVLNLPLGEVNQLTKLVPNALKAKLRDAFVKNPEIEDSGQLAEQRQDPRYARLFDFCEKLEELNRGTGLHASGIVISKTPLPDWVPVFTCKDKDSDKHLAATQFTLSEIESCGLVKMDYLGLQTLSILRHAEDLIRRRDGYDAFRVDTVPQDDAETFELFCQADTSGIFQFESPGMRRILTQAQPQRIEDLIALNALYRPGPMEYIPDFIAGKFDPKKIKYPDPSLRGILEETYGVMVYQEQVMQVAQSVAGYSLGQADILRRAMGKKKKEVMVAEKQKFIDGAVKSNFDANKAGDIFEIMLPFAGYGFNKSHAAAYSVVAYQSAYLKKHFPQEFIAASFTNEMNKTNGNLPGYIEETRGNGIVVDLPNINASRETFIPHNGKIAFALCAIKGVGQAAAEAIVKERERGGNFKSLFDFCERVDLRAVNKGTLEALIKSGAFDSLGGERSQYLAGLEIAIASGQTVQKNLADGTMNLFGDLPETEKFEPPLPNVAPWDLKIRLNFEREVLGFYASGHPLGEHSAVLKAFTTANSDSLAALPNKTTVTLGGMITGVNRKTDKHGKAWAIVSLEDEHGTVEIMTFARQYDEFSGILLTDALVLAVGKVDVSRDKPALIADRYLPLEDAPAQLAKSLTVTFPRAKITAEVVELVKVAVQKYPGKLPLFLQTQTPESRVVTIRAGGDFAIAPSPKLLADLRLACADVKVRFAGR